MAFEIYQHPLHGTKEERGHDERCEFVNNSSPSCDCDYHFGGNQYVMPNALKLMGWKADPSMERDAWYRTYGPHNLSICKVVSGWQYLWVRGMMTMHQQGSFGTPVFALDHLMGVFATQMDWFQKISWEHAWMKNELDKLGIRPREFMEPPPPASTAKPGPLRHEVTAIMDGQRSKDASANKPE